MFTGETTNVTNPELIWGTTQNITDQQDVVFPLKLGGNSSISIPQRIVDAYRMADGRDINNASAEYPYEDRPLRPDLRHRSRQADIEELHPARRHLQGL